MNEFSYLNMIISLLKDWIRKYDNDVIQGFISTIANKDIEMVLFNEFIQKNVTLENISKKYKIDPIRMEVNLRFLLLDWTKYVNGGFLNEVI